MANARGSRSDEFISECSVRHLVLMLVGQRVYQRERFKGERNLGGRCC